MATRIKPSRLKFERYREEEYQGTFPCTFPFYFYINAEPVRVKISRLNIFRLKIARV